MEAVERQQRVAELIGQHYELLYRVSFRLTGSVADAEDLTQQTFLTAQLKLHQLRDESAAKPWLLAILRHHFFRNRTRTKQKPVTFDRSVEPVEWADESAWDTDRLQLALNELSEEFRLPVVLFYFQEMSYQEIANELNVPVGTVMSRLSRAKQHLRRRLITEHETPAVSFPRPNLQAQLVHETR